MADVRSLLRNELASRKGPSQPNTTGHRVTKKRKVDSGEGLTRKKLRATELEAIQHAPGARPSETPGAQAEPEEEQIEETDIAGAEPLPEDDHGSVEPAMALRNAPPVAIEPPRDTSATVNEDEWAAFEREVAAPTRQPQAPAAVAAAATISAAPVSAEELATHQEREKMSTTQVREAELEGDREDAARFMEDEFDEMDQLEERVRRLKQKREELRMKRAEDQAVQDQTMAFAGVGTEVPQVEAQSESEDEDEDWDDWRFK